MAVKAISPAVSVVGMARFPVPAGERQFEWLIARSCRRRDCRYDKESKSSFWLQALGGDDARERRRISPGNFLRMSGNWGSGKMPWDPWWPNLGRRGERRAQVFAPHGKAGADRIGIGGEESRRRGAPRRRVEA
jgi:hypothetical protein